MRLFLLRHGDAVDEHIDPDRPLSEFGVAEIKKVASFLKNAKIGLDTIYHSRKSRAKQTAELIKKNLHVPTVLEEREYLFPNSARDSLLKDIEKNDGNMMIVGHLPFLSYLISRLVVNDENKPLVTMSTGTLVVLEKNTDSWSFVAMIIPEFL